MKQYHTHGADRETENGTASISSDKLAQIDTGNVESRMVVARNQRVLLDRDVAELYGVETKAINQAVRNNPDKFPEGYVWELTRDEERVLRSKILTLEQKPGKGHYSKHGYKVFTERGLYMLATILKGPRAVRATLAIIETYAQIRSMVRDMEALQSLRDGSPEQAAALTSAGHKLANVIGTNLSTESTKTTIELNLAVLKISHEITRTKDR